MISHTNQGDEFNVFAHTDFISLSDHILSFWFYSWHDILSVGACSTVLFILSILTENVMTWIQPLKNWELYQMKVTWTSSTNYTDDEIYWKFARKWSALILTLYVILQRVPVQLIQYRTNLEELITQKVIFNKKTV